MIFVAILLFIPWAIGTVRHDHLVLTSYIAIRILYALVSPTIDSIIYYLLIHIIWSNLDFVPVFFIILLFFEGGKRLNSLFKKTSIRKGTV